MEKSRKPVKLVFDTSAYVAALLSKTGGAATIFEQIIEQDAFNFYTEEIFTELKDVLARPKFHLEKEKQDHFLHLIQECSFEVQQIKEFVVKLCRDPNDDKFLSLAKQINADYLVTLDEDLLVLKQAGKTCIVTPGDFLALFKPSQ